MDPGQGRRSIFRIGGGGKIKKNVKIAIYDFARQARPQNWKLCMFISISIMLNFMVL